MSGPTRRAIKFEVREIADADRTIETVANDVNEAIAVARLYVEQWVTPRHFRKHRRQMRGSEGKRRCDTEAAAQLTGRQDRFKRGVYFGADASGVVAKRDAGLRQRGTACRPREKLDTEFGLQPE